MNMEVFEISDEDWETTFRYYLEYDYRKNHEYVRYKFFDLDIVHCMECGSNSLIDINRETFQSCNERKMHDALK